MNEEDRKIRQQLAGFHPATPRSEVDFMARLQQQMDAVDTVKDYCRAEKRHNRRAILAAGLAGIVAGVALTLALPHLSAHLGELIPWLIIAAGVVAAIFLAYSLTNLLTANSPQPDDLKPAPEISDPSGGNG